MGTYKTGILGSFTGKIGTVIGSTWKGIDYMRSLPKRSNRKTSDLQREQRLKFSMAAKFFRPVIPLLNKGFDPADAKSGYNMAMSYLIKNAFVGDYPDYTIDFSKVLISEGVLDQPSMLGLSAIEPGKLAVTWNASSLITLGKPDDRAIWMLYNQTKARAIYNLLGAERASLTEIIDVEEFSGDDVHVWFAFVTADGRMVSTSLYAGPIVVA